MFNQFAVVQRLSGFGFARQQYMLRLFVVKHVLVGRVSNAEYVGRIVGSAFELITVMVLKRRKQSAKLKTSKEKKTSTRSWTVVRYTRNTQVVRQIKGSCQQGTVLWSRSLMWVDHCFFRRRIQMINVLRQMLKPTIISIEHNNSV